MGRKSDAAFRHRSVPLDGTQGPYDEPSDQSHAASTSEPTHGVELCYFDGEAWKVICECGWEIWDQEREEVARNWHEKHAVAETWDD